MIKEIKIERVDLDFYKKVIEEVKKNIDLHPFFDYTIGLFTIKKLASEEYDTSLQLNGIVDILRILHPDIEKALSVYEKEKLGSKRITF